MAFMAGAREQIQEFVCEPLRPLGGFDVLAMSRGLPGLPAAFEWRGRRREIQHVLRQWKTSTREGGVGELYLRRHWYEIVTGDGLRMTIYCDRQTKTRRKRPTRWWVYTANSLKC
jgi:hypothetical protein